MIVLRAFVLFVLIFEGVNSHELSAQNVQKFGASGVVSHGGKLLVVGDRDRNELLELSIVDLQLKPLEPMNYTLKPDGKKVFDTGLEDVKQQIDSAFNNLEDKLNQGVDDLHQQLPTRLSLNESTRVTKQLSELLAETKREHIRASERYKNELTQFEDIAIFDGVPVVICESMSGRAALLCPNGPIATYDFSRLTEEGNVGLEGLDVVPFGSQSQVAVLFEGVGSKSPRLFFHRLGTDQASQRIAFELSEQSGVRMSRNAIRRLADESWEPELKKRNADLSQLKASKQVAQEALKKAAQSGSTDDELTPLKEQIQTKDTLIEASEAELKTIEEHRNRMLEKRMGKKLRAPAVVMGRFQSAADSSKSNCAVVLVQDAEEIGVKWIVVISLGDDGSHQFEKVFSLRQLLGKEMVKPNWEGLCWHGTQLVIVNDNTLGRRESDPTRLRNLVVLLDFEGLSPPGDNFRLSDKLQLEPLVKPK